MCLIISHVDMSSIQPIHMYCLALGTNNVQRMCQWKLVIVCLYWHLLPMPWRQHQYKFCSSNYNIPPWGVVVLHIGDRGIYNMLPRQHHCTREIWALRCCLGNGLRVWTYPSFQCLPTPLSTGVKYAELKMIFGKQRASDYWSKNHSSVGHTSYLHGNQTGLADVPISFKLWVATKKANLHQRKCNFISVHDFTFTPIGLSSS